MVLALAITVIFVSCKGNDTVSVTGVTLNKTVAELTVGDTETLTGTVMPENATDKRVEWTSSNEAVATVAGGVVTAITEGTATITVTTKDGTKTAGCLITVIEEDEEPVPVTGVTLDKPSIELKPGDSETLTATVVPENATNKNISWESSSDAVATVTDGVVTAIAKGTATITVITEEGEKTAKCTVTVEVPVVEPDVYVVGTEMDSSYTTYAVLWKNGTLERLSSGSSEANFVYVSGDDVYIAGRNALRATLWKNGTAQQLSEMNSFARSVYVAGNDVYVAGMVNDEEYVPHATIWKNGTATTLSNNSSYINSVAVLAGDVYAVGDEMGVDNNMYATLWINGVAQRLSDNPSEAKSVHISENDVYIAWNGDGAYIWKNGTNRMISNNAAGVNNVYASGDDVYAAGAYMERDNNFAIMWENYAVKELSSTYSNAYCVAVYGDNIYVAGEDAGTAGMSRATIWKNSTPQTLSNNASRANSIFVK